MSGTIRAHIAGDRGILGEAGDIDLDEAIRLVLKTGEVTAAEVEESLDELRAEGGLLWFNCRLDITFKRLDKPCIGGEA